MGAEPQVGEVWERNGKRWVVNRINLANAVVYLNLANDSGEEIMADLGSMSLGANGWHRGKTRRQIVLDTANDLAGRFLYYDRKEDDSLPVFAIEDAIIAGEVALDEIVGILRYQLETSVARRKQDKAGG
ncbi:MAG TPA: hypothetical protein VK509_21340 [Polyangiales bacterium]|nr:hypothetical protein [Polyangiales bacterium]